jgi:uncharacterized membrane protein
VQRPEGDPPEGVPLSLRLSHLALLLLLTAAYAVVSAIDLAGVYPSLAPWINLPLGLVVLFVAPGYGLVALGVGERPRWPWYLTWILIVGLSVGFNLAIGFVLLEFHLGLPGFVLALGALVVDGAALARFVTTPPMVEDTRFSAMVRAQLRLPGFSPGQRAAAYALFLAIVLVFGTVVYIASVHPHQPSDVSFGITNPAGNVTGIPQRQSINSHVEILADIGNNGTTQTWTLVVESSPKAFPGTSFTPVVWAVPIPLGPNVTSSELVPTSANQALTVPVTFSFTQVGDYTVSFLLETAGGATVRQATISLVIF